MLLDFHSPLEILPEKTWLKIGSYFSFQDLNQIALTAKMGKTFANSILDILAKEIECSGKTMKDRRLDLAKLYKEISPNFIRSLFADIDKIKDRAFENGKLTVEYGEESYTSFFIENCALKMFHWESFGCEEIVPEFQKTVTTDYGWKRIYMFNDVNKGIKIKQTPSNHVSNVISTKLLEALKKASILYFNKLCLSIKIPDVNSGNSWPDKEKLDKYKNKCALIIYEKDKKKSKLDACHCVIAQLLVENGFWNKVDFLNYNTLTGVYGEKEDIQKFVTILNAQQFPDIPPSMATLKEARGLPN